MKRIQLYVAAILLVPALATSVGAQDANDSHQSSIPRAAVVDPEKKDPAATAEKVTEALKQAEGVPSKDIAVSSHAGIIVLTGEVNSEAEGVKATSAAEAAADGARVNSALEVRAPEDRPVQLQKSTQLVRDVEQALRNDKRTADLGVAVSSEKNGVVVLHGLIPSDANRSAAQSVASRVAGVTKVESRLMVPTE